MDEKIAQALAQDRVIEITTIGRKTGRPRRIEIWFHNLNGRIFITGFPGRRSWYANLLAHPEFSFHLKESVRTDLPARATPITDETQRFIVVLPDWQNRLEPEDLRALTPLIYAHVNPYGRFYLDMDERLPLDE